MKDQSTGQSSRDDEATVLIVEDSPQVVELLETFLGDVPGIRTVSALDGEEGMARLQDARPDLVLLDLMIPKLSGFELCRRIKDDPRTRLIPVIIVTALDMNADYERARECGADDFLRKPINRIELLTRIESLLELGRLRRHMESARSQKPQRSPSTG
jgi:two-component system cell cycle response regulator